MFPSQRNVPRSLLSSKLEVVRKNDAGYDDETSVSRQKHQLMKAEQKGTDNQQCCLFLFCLFYVTVLFLNPFILKLCFTGIKSLFCLDMPKRIFKQVFSIV